MMPHTVTRSRGHRGRWEQPKDIITATELAVLFEAAKSGYRDPKRTVHYTRTAGWHFEGCGR